MMKNQQNISLTLSYFFFFVWMMYASVNAQTESTDPNIVSGHIHVKFTPEVHKSLSMVDSDEKSWKTNHPQLESLTKNLSVYQMQPALLTYPKFQERHKKAGIDRWFVLYLADKGTEWSAIEAFSKSGLVEIAEPDYESVLYEDEAFPKDPRINDQWHYKNTGQNDGLAGADISLFDAWNISTGLPDVVVQVVDSGIMREHNDLKNMLWVNPSPSFTFDVHGWNFRSGNNNIEDDNGHGTHVSGTIAAQTNNELGVAGVAGGDGSGNGVRLMIARLFETAGGSNASSTMNAFIYGADNGAVISNNSWGYSSAGVFPTMVRDGIDYFIDNAGFDENGNVTGPIAGGVVIFASGNNNSSNLYFPGAYERVINVAATNNKDIKSYYSNFGEHIDISATGGEIIPLTAGGVLSTEISSRGLIGYRQGTSMAAPHVTGVAALMASHFVNMTNSQMVERILAAVDNINTINPQHAGLLGSGRLNAYKALSTDSPPAIPKLVSPAPDTVDVQINARFNWNESALAESYRIQISTSENFETSAIILDEVVFNQTSKAFNQLNLETDYFWRVRGVNAFGEGRWSDVRKFTTTDRVPPLSPVLAQNYPNPFNPSTNIEFGLNETTDVTLEVYNYLGQRVSTVFTGSLDAGWHIYPFNATGLASGVYLYRLRAGNSQITQKMLLIK